MISQHPLAGVYAAAVTPLLPVTEDGKTGASPLDLEAVPGLARLSGLTRLSRDRALRHNR